MTTVSLWSVNDLAYRSLTNRRQTAGKPPANRRQTVRYQQETRQRTASDLPENCQWPARKLRETCWKLARIPLGTCRDQFSAQRPNQRNFQPKFPALVYSYNSLSTYELTIRRPVVSTNQAYPSCFYFRISWILMEQLSFYFLRPLRFLQGLRSLKQWLL